MNNNRVVTVTAVVGTVATVIGTVVTIIALGLPKAGSGRTVPSPASSTVSTPSQSSSPPPPPIATPSEPLNLESYLNSRISAYIFSSCQPNRSAENQVTPAVLNCVPIYNGMIHPALIMLFDSTNDMNGWFERVGPTYSTHCSTDPYVDDYMGAWTVNQVNMGQLTCGMVQNHEHVLWTFYNGKIAAVADISFGSWWHESSNFVINCNCPAPSLKPVS